MGRYYSGDVEGKFWFGVQPSTAPAHLGAAETHITYYFSDVDDLFERLKKIKEALGSDYEKLEKIFASQKYYTDEEIQKKLNLTKERLYTVMGMYADYKLGEKVFNYMKKNNSDCEIVAEL